jgi:PIN domain
VFAAVLDTCVLWPSLQRDFLLSLAVEGLYRPLWSSVILDELRYQEAAKHARRGVPRVQAHQRAQRLITQMCQAFDDADVTGWEPLEGSYQLPDPNDEHVVAAAVLGGAGAIVTHNHADFPADRLPPGLHVLPPAAFAANTVALDPVRSVRAVQRIAQRSGRRGPTYTVTDILDQLDARYDLTSATAPIRHLENDH